jgi:hypothetical protein
VHNSNLVDDFEPIEQGSAHSATCITGLHILSINSKRGIRFATRVALRFGFDPLLQTSSGIEEEILDAVVSPSSSPSRGNLCISLSGGVTTG